jgi:hypothetical protein
MLQSAWAFLTITNVKYIVETKRVQFWSVSWTSPFPYNTFATDSRNLKQRWSGNVVLPISGISAVLWSLMLNFSYGMKAALGAHLIRDVKSTNFNSIYFVRFEVSAAVTMKNGIFWDVMPYGSCKNRRFGGTWRLLHQSDMNRWTRNNTSCN